MNFHKDTDKDKDMTTDAETPTPAPAEDPKPNKYQSSEVLSTVAERLGNSGPVVRERVVETLVEREVASRVETLDKALSKRNEYTRELRKLEKPDVEAFDADGKVTSSSFSKARVDELKKAREGLAKLEGAIDKALTNNDFAKLREIVSK